MMSQGEVTKQKGGKGKKLLLVPENAEYETIAVDAEQEFEVWGVVTHVIHSL